MGLDVAPSPPNRKHNYVAAHSSMSEKFQIEPQSCFVAALDGGRGSSNNRGSTTTSSGSDAELDVHLGCSSSTSLCTSPAISEETYSVTSSISSSSSRYHLQLPCTSSTTKDTLPQRRPFNNKKRDETEDPVKRDLPPRPCKRRLSPVPLVSSSSAPETAAAEEEEAASPRQDDNDEDDGQVVDTYENATTTTTTTPQKHQGEAQLPPPPPPSLEPTSPVSSTSTSSTALMKLARQFVNVVHVATHNLYLKTYKDTFVGSDAVNCMLQTNLATTREDAVFLGRRFAKELNLFYHVNWDHSFKDGNRYLYRFNTDSDYYILLLRGGTSSTSTIKDITNTTTTLHPAGGTTSAAAATSAANVIHVSKFHLRAIATTLEREIRVCKHMSRFKTYNDTFSGNEAVDTILKIHCDIATDRKHAVFLGQRLMDELNIFHHVTYKHDRFKDDSQSLYRFSKEQRSSRMSTYNIVDEAIREVSSSTFSFTAPTSTANEAENKFRTNYKRLDRKVSFGVVQERHFERALVINPSTSSGPSIGLGWGYVDQPTSKLSSTVDDVEVGTSFSRHRHEYKLSSDVRKRILASWGHTKKEMNQAAKTNERIKKQRKQSSNQSSARALRVERLHEELVFRADCQLISEGFTANEEEFCSFFQQPEIRNLFLSGNGETSRTKQIRASPHVWGLWERACREHYGTDSLPSNSDNEDPIVVATEVEVPFPGFHLRNTVLNGCRLTREKEFGLPEYTFCMIGDMKQLEGNPSVLWLVRRLTGWSSGPQQMFGLSETKAKTRVSIVRKGRNSFQLKTDIQMATTTTVRKKLMKLLPAKQVVEDHGSQSIKKVVKKNAKNALDKVVKSWLEHVQTCQE